MAMRWLLLPLPLALPSFWWPCWEARKSTSWRTSNDTLHVAHTMQHSQNVHDLEVLSFWGEGGGAVEGEEGEGTHLAHPSRTLSGGRMPC